MKKLVLVSLLAFIAPLLNGQVLVSWNFSADNDTTYEFLDPGLTGGVLDDAGGLIGPDYTFGVDTISWTGFSNNLANSIADSDWVSFTVSTVDSGQFMSLSQLTFTASRDSARPANLNVYLNGTSTLLGSYTLGTSATTYTIDIAANFPSHANQQTATFNFVGYNGNASGSGALIFGGISGNDLVLTGEVIPEPSTYALIFGGVSLLGVLVWKRRARSKELAPAA